MLLHLPEYTADVAVANAVLQTPSTITIASAATRILILFFILISFPIPNI